MSCCYTFNPAGAKFMNRKNHMAFPRAAIRFQNEFLDFRKGIRVGHLEDNQRITRILKLALEARYQEEFVTERFGRGVYWQWIGFVSRSNRSCKPISSKVSFGCSKFFLTIDQEEQLFKCGFSVERGTITPQSDFPQIQLQSDWDWHRLLDCLTRGSQLEKELKRLVIHEDFSIDAGNWDDRYAVSSGKFPGVEELKKVLTAAPPDKWAGFQVYYPMPEKDIRASTGADLVDAMMAIFGETTPAMNLCMQTQLKNAGAVNQ
jgi:hypothetical protein